jgi:hypothetical protein
MNEHQPQVWRPLKAQAHVWSWACTCGAGDSGLIEDEADLQAEAHVQDMIDLQGRPDDPGNAP